MTTWLDDDTAKRLAGMAGGGLHEKLGDAIGNPKTVRCRKCGRECPVDSARALRLGWPKCCGETMTIDPPDEPA